jgi:hypothetical protein
MPKLVKKVVSYETIAVKLLRSKTESIAWVEAENKAPSIYGWSIEVKCMVWFLQVYICELP